jgi:hypothetical protein
VLVAREQGRPLGDLPDDAAISVVTVAELHLGVLRSFAVIVADARRRGSKG